MKPPEDVTRLILALRAQGYTKGSIVREIKKYADSREQATQYVDEVLTARKDALRENLDMGVDEARKALVGSGLTSLGCFALGSVITGITYSMAEDGGTYTVTTGLFLVGAITGLVALFQLLRWLYYLSRRRILSGKQSLTTGPQSTGSTGARSWNDLE